MTKWLALSWYWLRSRYAPQNAFVRCETCPNWIFHSHVKMSTRVENMPDPGAATDADAHDRLPTDPLACGLLPFPTLALDYRAGVCALDRPKVFNDFTTGFALKVWTGHDWCPRHPLFEPHIVQGSNLEYRPGDATLGSAGFNRLPTFQEAVAMALKNSKADAITEQSSGQLINNNDSDNRSH